MQYADVMHQFAARHSLEDLTDETLKHLYDGNFSIDKAHDFINFYHRIEAELLTHPVISDNPYTIWFKQAELKAAEVRHFLVQFSVVTNQLLIARVHRVVNASTPEQMRLAKHLLVDTLDTLADPVELAAQVGLSFGDLGPRDRGTPSTLFFCDELIRLYGSTHVTTAEAAAFSIDNWSAATFWRDLVEGLQRYQKSTMAGTAFSWPTATGIDPYHPHPYSALPYNKEQLENSYFTHNLDEELYMEKGYEMLDGIYAFWKGLDDDRKRLH